MGPDVEKYTHGTYAQATPHTDSPSLSKPGFDIDCIEETVSANRNNAFLPPLTGIRIVLDKDMNPNDCMFVVGKDFFKKMKDAFDDENSKAKT